MNIKEQLKAAFEAGRSTRTKKDYTNWNANDHSDYTEYEAYSYKTFDDWYSAYALSLSEPGKEAEWHKSFFLRLKMFVSAVNVNDPMSEEEKDFILRTCDKNLHSPDTDK